jgi:hypothetical protein
MIKAVSQGDQGVNAAPGQAAQEQFKKIHGVHEEFPYREKTDNPGDGHPQCYTNPTHVVLS